jgi:hypothetical protein
MSTSRTACAVALAYDREDGVFTLLDTVKQLLSVPRRLLRAEISEHSFRPAKQQHVGVGARSMLYRPCSCRTNIYAAGSASPDSCRSITSQERPTVMQVGDGNLAYRICGARLPGRSPGPGHIRPCRSWAGISEHFQSGRQKRTGNNTALVDTDDRT